MSERVLLTGGTGLIGGPALSLLVARGWDVHALSSRPQEAVEGVTWHTVDLTDTADVARVVPRIGASHLLHFAWSVRPGQVWNSPENVRWVEASLALVRAFADGPGRRAVLAGSCGEYLWGDAPCSEHSTPIAPRTVYGSCKAALLDVLTAAAPALGLSAAWGRIFFVYGPGEHPDRLVAAVVRSLLAGREAETSHGRQVRDYLHSADVAAAFVDLLESDVAGPVNIGSGTGVELREIATLAAEIVGRLDLLRLGARPAADFEPSRIVGDVSRLRSEVGFSPRFTLEAGLADTVEWWRARALDAVEAR